MLGTGATDFRLDPADVAQQGDDLGGNRRSGALMQIDEAPTQVSKAERELDASGQPVWALQALVGSIAIDLEHALIAAKLLGYRAMASGSGMDVAHCRWRRPVPGTVVRAVSPELIDADFAIAAANHGHPGFVDVDAVVTMDCPQLQIVETSQPPGRTLQPARQRSINLQAMPCQHLGLAINGRYQAKRCVTIQEISEVVAIPPSIILRGAGAWTMPPSQVRQAYLGRTVAITRRTAGTMSRALAHVLTDLVHAAFSRRTGCCQVR
jgi:hypothetical protein